MPQSYLASALSAVATVIVNAVVVVALAEPDALAVPDVLVESDALAAMVFLVALDALAALVPR